MLTGPTNDNPCPPDLLCLIQYGAGFVFSSTLRAMMATLPVPHPANIDMNKIRIEANATGFKLDSRP